VSALAVWFLLYAFVFSGLQEARSQHGLYAQLRTRLAQQVAPLGGNIPAGTPVAVLKVPAAGIDDVVVEGTTSGILEDGPGLLADSPLPGQAGVSVIFGRQAMFGGPFRHLASLRPGDPLIVTTGQGTFTYVVSDLRSAGDPVPASPSAGQGRLTLVTAVGSGWRAVWAPSQLIYVDATLKGAAVSSPAGRPTEVRASELAMHGDSNALVPLVLWLELLVVVVVAVVWTLARWGTWQTWLIGAPALLAVLWMVTGSVVQLLPNLL
jgi:sortase A